MWALHGASISILPATFTLERKQYQPFGFSSRMTLLPMTFTAGRTSTSAGLSVAESLTLPLPPTPNTFTLGAMTESAGVPFLKGEALAQELMHASSAGWSSLPLAASTQVDTRVMAMAGMR